MADRAPRILLVDDEQPIQTLLSFPLQRDGYEVVQAADGAEALARYSEQIFDLVVLDVMLPRMDGLEVCRRLRAKGETVPIIMLTAKSEEIDKVLGLELGADDYITKPFSMREFRSRVKAALRRSGMARTDTDDERPIDVRGLRIDPGKRTVARNGEVVPTTYVEFEILAALARSPGRVFTRDMLLARVWGDSAYRDPRTIDVHIRHLREKIEVDPKEPEYLFTVRGVGYRFRDEDGSAGVAFAAQPAGRHLRADHHRRDRDHLPVGDAAAGGVADRAAARPGARDHTSSTPAARACLYPRQGLLRRRRRSRARDSGARTRLGSAQTRRRVRRLAERIDTEILVMADGGGRTVLDHRLHGRRRRHEP